MIALEIIFWCAVILLVLVTLEAIFTIVPMLWDDIWCVVCGLRDLILHLLHREDNQ